MGFIAANMSLEGYFKKFFTLKMSLAFTRRHQKKALHVQGSKQA
jgi:hypothetical protein